MSARDVVELLDELQAMYDRAGGLAHRVPTDERAAWERRKADVLARIEAPIEEGAGNGRPHC